MQVFFLKSRKHTPTVSFNLRDSNHKEFNMKILYLYSSTKIFKKNIVRGVIKSTFRSILSKISNQNN
ncbi:hypothetical protein FLSI110296_01590 [Flavobacterium sinopsychrotolerans]